MSARDEWQDSWIPYLKTKSKNCHLSTWNFLVDAGEIPLSAAGSQQWCLHHIDPAMLYFQPEKYCEWNLSDVVPMTTSDHVKLHRDFDKRNAAYGLLDSIFEQHMNVMS